MTTLSAELEQLSEWLDRLPRLGMETLGGTGAPMFVLDFVFIGAVKRSLSLASGLHTLVVAKNIVCSRAILRMQLDTVSRMLAYTYVDNPQAVAKAVIGGTPLKKFKCRDGKALMDGYLIDRMSHDHPWVRKVYDFTSGYVHFSERQFFDSVQKMGSNEERTVTLQISHIDNSFPDASWTEIAACFNHLMALLAGILTSYSQSKQRGKATTASNGNA